jgi:hypothetical protein
MRGRGLYAIARVVDISVAAAWGIGSYSLAKGDEVAAARVQAVVDSAAMTRISIGIIAGLQLYLAVALVLGPSKKTRVWSLVLLGGLSIALAVDGLKNGWGVECGCLSALVRQSAGAAVVRNVALLAASAFAIVVERKGTASRGARD